MSQAHKRIIWSMTSLNVNKTHISMSIQMSCYIGVRTIPYNNTYVTQRFLSICQLEKLNLTVIETTAAEYNWTWPVKYHLGTAVHTWALASWEGSSGWSELRRFSKQTPIAATVPFEEGKSRWFGLPCSGTHISGCLLSCWVSRIAGNPAPGDNSWPLCAALRRSHMALITPCEIQLSAYSCGAIKNGGNLHPDTEQL